MRFISIIVVLLTVGACSLFPPVTVLEGASAVSTGKPFSDHIVSYASGKDCSTSREASGQTYCKEDEINVAPKIWCYRTLGSVTCYDRPDPLEGNQRKMGNNDHNTQTAQ
ncbi:MAG: hypothetical protein HQ504_08530 [Rhodospirillaceae bacterium]|nr:hypothetical protein [Rhodospirillaceae bacterium]